MSKHLVYAAIIATIAASPIHAADPPIAHHNESTASSTGDVNVLHHAFMNSISEIHDVPMPPTPDRVFVSVMIQRHQQALELARAILDYSTNADTQKQARSIIDSTEKLLAELRVTQANLPK